MPTSVLVVDDSTTAFQQLKRILEEAGYTIAGHASSGEEAVSLYRSTKPDIVTMDIVMPGLDGVEAVRQILAEDPAARVVIVSSLGGVKDRAVAALSAGAKSVIAKPFEKDRVLEVLRTLT